MSKEFKPIFSIRETLPRLGEFRDDVQRLREEKEKVEEELSRILQKLRVLEEENRSIKKRLGELQEELAHRERKLTELSEELSKRETALRVAEAVSERLNEQLRSVRDSLRGDFVRIAREVIREFLMTDLIPKEEVVTKILEEVFTKVADLRGSIKIHLNPQEVDRAYEFTGAFSEKISGRMEVEIIADSNLKEGEVRIETPKFVIERKQDEILDEIMREVLRRVLEGG